MISFLIVIAVDYWFEVGKNLDAFQFNIIIECIVEVEFNSHLAKLITATKIVFDWKELAKLKYIILWFEVKCCKTWVCSTFLYDFHIFIAEVELVL